MGASAQIPCSSQIKSLQGGQNMVSKDESRFCSRISLLLWVIDSFSADLLPGLNDPGASLPNVGVTVGGRSRRVHARDGSVTRGSVSFLLEVIRPPRRERKDWQYYQGTGKKLTMPHRRGSTVCQSCRRVDLSSITATCQTFGPPLVVLPVSLSAVNGQIS